MQINTDSKEKTVCVTLGKWNCSIKNIHALTSAYIAIGDIQDGKKATVEISQICEGMQMPCYKSGGCGTYEMLSCNECPASKPEYLLRSKHPCDGCDHGWGTANENGIEVCNDTCKEFKDWSEQQAMAKLCGQCNKTDGMCYTSNPPKVKCTVTGEFHLYDDKCNIKSPRICDVLGVEQGEKFCITYTSHATRITRTCRIDENGDIVSDEGRLPAEALSQIINYPERIVKTAPLSDKEIEAIKAIKNLFPTAEYVEHIKNSDIVGIGNSENGWIADINNALFPSLKPGDHIDIDAVMAGGLDCE